MGTGKSRGPKCPHTRRGLHAGPQHPPWQGGGDAGMGIGGDPVWPQDPSLHQGSHFWVAQNNLASSLAFSHLGAALGWIAFVGLL